MTPRIEISEEKKLVGKRLKMSFAKYNIEELWRSFMPRRKEIINSLTTDLISMVVYKTNHFEDFKPTNEFVRWATIEVSDFENVPNEMETFVLPSGKYAVFSHVGDVSAFQKTSQYIYNIWLPNSEYIVDDRPHFEILGHKYKNDDPNSEEEIWIPIKTKQEKTNH
jgi:AraC family transcriptional regulator